MYNPIVTIIEDEDLEPYLMRLQMKLDREFKEYQKLLTTTPNHYVSSILANWRIEQFHMNKNNSFRVLLNMHKQFIGLEKLTMH